jgi:hypothetical protein
MSLFCFIDSSAFLLKGKVEATGKSENRVINCHAFLVINATDSCTLKASDSVGVWFNHIDLSDQCYNFFEQTKLEELKINLVHFFELEFHILFFFIKKKERTRLFKIVLSLNS